MNDIKKIISDIISEAALDHRIPDGVIDLYNTDHVQVIAEKMYDAGADENSVNEFIDRFVSEGKHPDRQAYNKDGWLVTFPSKEYRDAAIKRGTHSASDPTHGKGGMNLYYKKKGKQKRQIKQVQTVVGQDTSKEQPKVPAQPQEQPTQAQQQKKPDDVEKKKRPAPGRQVSPPDDEGSFDYDMSKVKKPEETPKEEPSSEEKPKDSEKPQPKVQQGQPASEQPEPTSAVPSSLYVDISKKFASLKGWASTPYGEYRDLSGETQAIVGLSGEIIPIKSVDRDELKLFFKKSQG